MMEWQAVVLNRCVFALIRVSKIEKSDYWIFHVCLSVRMEQLGSHWTYLYEI